MLENIILWVLIIIELSYLVFSLLRKSNFRKEKSVVNIVLFTVFLILVLSPVIDWGFKWTMLAFFLGLQALLGSVVLILNMENSIPKKIKLIFAGLGRILLIIMLVLPTLLFPQYDLIKSTGEYSVGTISYTLTDESREEHFTEEKDKRNVTIQFWYPTKQSGQFPLIIFSHGAFGYRMSNYSTYQELASHGYIVCSIDHTYHAFMTKQTDGKTIIANTEFMNAAMKAQNGDTSPAETYALEEEWMKLRTEDMSFVLNHIKKMSASANADAVYQSIDLEHIGVFGHSLGGATAAKIGRDDQDVDAVIVVDGTMMGEIIGFENGEEIINDIPYPKPILNIYNESHYTEAIENKDKYPNMIAYKNALDSYQMVFKGSGHMNFTDLPIISPFLSNMLETGDKAVTVDARYCINTTNKAILEFFDYYLKSNKVEIPKERFL